MKFRKKPVIIEAWQYVPDPSVEPMPQWLADALAQGIVNLVNGSLTIQTLEGVHKANLDDWIIQGVKGELYPCKPDIFEATYEQVND